MLTRSIASWVLLQKPPVLKPLQKSAPCFVLCRLVPGGPTFGASEPKSASGMMAKYQSVLCACPSVRPHDPPSFVACAPTATSSSFVTHPILKLLPSSYSIIRSFDPFRFCPHTKFRF